MKFLVFSLSLLLVGCGPKFSVGDRVYFFSSCTGIVKEVIQWSEAVSYRLDPAICDLEPIKPVVMPQKALRGSQ